MSTTRVTIRTTHRPELPDLIEAEDKVVIRSDIGPTDMINICLVSGEILAMYNPSAVVSIRIQSDGESPRTQR